MRTRKPIVAGQFYPADRGSCIEEINECLAARTLPKSLPQEIVAGIVPHAGWMFSGNLAAMVFSAVKQQHPNVHTFVIFGAAHGYYGDKPVLDDSDFWETPLGRVGTDFTITEYLLKQKVAVVDFMDHKGEHSIEVQVPFVQYLFPKARILPIIVPPNEQAIPLGKAIGEYVKPWGTMIVCIGSTDLTHYGPRYGFVPMGLGKDGLDWAAKVNDKQFIDMALKLDPEGILAGAAENLNACGAGAAAASVSVARKVGKTAGLLLAQTNSNEVMRRKMGTYSQDSVGYAAILF